MSSLIRIENVSKTFETKERMLYALKNVSLEIEKGDIFGIIGLSGAGKSTLMRCLTSLEKPSSGKVLIKGQDIAKMSEKELLAFRKKIGMIFQHFNLLSSRTAAGNIAYPLEIDNECKRDPAKDAARVEELLKLVGLSSKKEAYPTQMSGGEKQRVGIARAIANGPDILFCDEATSALDPKTTKETLALLKHLQKSLGLTIVLITHQMEVIKQICNKVAVLDKGEIVEKGSLAEVFTDPKHPMTAHFLQNTIHEIPPHFFKESSPYRKLMRLHFKGINAGEPIISQIIKRFAIEANILLGWIDCLQTVTVGTLIIEFLGPPEKISEALVFLTEQGITFEALHP